MRQIFFIILLAGLTTALKGQEQIIYENSTRENYLVRYDAANDPSQRIVNAIIEEIARQPYKNKFSVQVTFSYLQHLRITKKGDFVTAYLDLKHFNANGDIYYRDFNLSDVLIPSSVTINAELLNQNNKLIKSFAMPVAAINPNKTTFVFTGQDTLNSTNYTFRIKNLQFYYDENTKAGFYTRMGMIEDYYKAVLGIEKWLGQLEMMPAGNIDMLSQNQNSLHVATNFVNQTERLSLPAMLDLQSFDPYNYIGGINALKNLIYNLGEELNRTYNNRHEIYYNRAIEMIAKNDKQSGKNYLLKSLEANPAFPPSMYQLAKLEFMEGNFDGAAYRLRELLNNSRPDDDLFRFATELARNLTEAYINAGDNLYNSKNYAGALEVYEKTIAFCTNLNGYSCPQVLGQKISLSRTGIYNSYLDQANRYIQQGKLTEAEKEVRNAISYQSANSNDIMDNKAAVVLLTNIKQIEYKNALTEGKGHLVAKNYELALQALQRAELIEKDYAITKSNELPGLLKTAARPYIISELTRGNQMVIKNQLDEARNILSKVITLQSNYGLASDKTINTQVNELRKKIFSQECLNAQGRFDTIIFIARQNIAKLDFIVAEGNFNDAAKVIEQNASCGISRTEMDSLKLAVLPAITYQKVIVEVYQQLGRNFYEQAIKRYLDAEGHFYQQNVERFNLVHKSLPEFIAGEKNDFVLYAISYFLNKKDPDNALFMLKVLKSRGYKDSKLKTQLRATGTALAVRDIGSGKMDKNNNVRLYTGGEKWFKQLTKYYLKTYK